MPLEPGGVAHVALIGLRSGVREGAGGPLSGVWGAAPMSTA